MRAAVLTGWQRWCTASPLAQDSFLYLCSACFALVTAEVALSGDYRQWGQMAAVAYGVGLCICFGAFLYDRRRRLSPTTIGWTRRVVLLLLLLGAVLIPLGAELAWRAEARPGAHAQPEVAVIERAGDRVASGKDPYLAHPNQVGTPPSGDQRGVDSESFFPYLPGMVPFGYLNSLGGPPELRDARVALAGFTLLVAIGALAASDASLGRRGRALQWLVVLPSGALPMVTGGDDLPVLALLLLGLILVERRRPVLAGLVIGCAGTLKFTAWPLLVLLAFAVRDKEERPAPLRYGLSVALIVVPVVGAGFLASPSSFIMNVVRFPLGLTTVKSPAASPLLGQVFVNLLPHHKTAVTAVLVLIGAAIVLVAFALRRPTTAASAARFTAFAMCVATVLAPATRFGYLIYPANLVVWGWVLDEMGRRRSIRMAETVPEALQSSSSSSITRKSTVLVGALSPLPDSAGEIDGLTGSTSTPTSQ